ncbi:MAG: sulfotransferase, partial [Halieaceae bacterium]
MDLTVQSLTQLAETEASGSLDLTSFESEILSRLIEALNSTGGLNSAGIGFHHQRLVEILKNRIAIEQWFNTHPEINEEHISDPIVVVG